MRIRRATVSGFRNLAEDSFEFSPGVNLLLGANGEGKTNLLEALNFFAFGRSHRGGRSLDLIAFDEQVLHVQLEIEEESGAVVACEYGLDRDGSRRFKVDGEPVARRSDLVGRLVTVFFNPDSVAVVRGAPQGRRQFVDQGLVEIQPAALAHLTACQRALKQKTGLLRDLRRGLVDGDRARRELVAWNRELATHAAEVCRGRARYASLMTAGLQANHNLLTGNEMEARFSYRPRFGCVADGIAGNAAADLEIDDLERDILTEFDYIMESEIRRGRPLLGPQLDDFSIQLDGVDLRVYGSQGETRTAAVAMIMARSDVLYDQRRIRPVLFLDDIFSELDPTRTRRLQEMAAEQHQVFIATARPDDVADWRPAGMRTWKVAAGSFTPVEA